MAKDRIVIPGIGKDAARVIIDRMRAQEERIAILERTAGRSGVISSDTAAKPGEFLNIEAPSSETITIVLPESTPARRNARVTLAFRNANPVRIVAVAGTVNGEAFATSNQVGTFDAVADGLGGWSVQLGLTSAGPSGGALDAEYVLGAAHASLPNGRVATDSTEVDAVLTTPNVISWALNVASVAFSKLANLTGLSVLGRAATTTGAMAAITATAANQKLVSNRTGTSLEWVSDLPAVFIDTVTGSIGTYDLPSTFRNGDTLRLTITGNTTVVGFTIGGAVPDEGTEFNLCLSDQSGGSAPGWTLTIPDAGGGVAQFRTPGQVQGTVPGPSYVMQSEEEGIRCAFQQGAWRIIGGTAGQAITGAIEVSAGNGSTRTSVFATAASGAGLTGGGTAILAVGGSTSITVNANDIQRAALTGFAAASANSNATTSAEPIVTYSASANMSAERVTTSSTSVTVSTSVANQIEFQRAAITGAVSAGANANATQFAGIRDNGTLETARGFINVLSTSTITALGTQDAGNDEIELTWAVNLTAVYTWTGDHSIGGSADWTMNSSGDFGVTAAVASIISSSTILIDAVGDLTLASDGNVVVQGDALFVSGEGFIIVTGETGSTPSLTAGQGMYWALDPGSPATRPQYTNDSNVNCEIIHSGPVQTFTTSGTSNDVALNDTTRILRVDTGAANWVITGFAGTLYDGRELIVVSAQNSGQTGQFSHLTGSAAGQQIVCPDNTSYPVVADVRTSAIFIYDGTDSVWRLVAGNKEGVI